MGNRSKLRRDQSLLQRGEVILKEVFWLLAVLRLALWQVISAILLVWIMVVALNKVVAEVIVLLDSILGRGMGATVLAVSTPIIS